MKEDSGKKLSLEGFEGSGIMWVNAKITRPEDLSRSLFTQWYDQVHIPDVVGVDGIVAGSRYESEEQDDEKPYLAIYRIPELDVIQKNIDFKSVPQHHPMLPGGQSVYLYAEFDTRFYKRVRVQEKENAREGRSSTLQSVVIDPAVGTGGDFDRWCSEAYLEMITQYPSWSRSTSYELIFGGVKGEYSTLGPRYLVIHEYEEGTAPSQVPDGKAQREWRVFDSRVFKLCSEYGESNVTL